jgi:hypothetical protein
MRGSLDFLRKSSQITRGVVDSWDLVHVGLAAVRELESKVWIHSFKKVNLHPHHRVSFADWCKCISHHLQGGLAFKEESVVDAYALLSPFWHGMMPEEKKLAMTIFQSHENKYSVACVRELHSRVHIPLSDMQALRVCLEHAEQDPSHLDRGVPEKPACNEPAEVVTAKAAVADINQGLSSFMLHPKKADGSQLLSGAAKFDHLSKLARRSVPQGTPLLPSAHLDVEVSKAQAREVLNPTPTDYMMHAIAATTTGAAAKQVVPPPDRQPKPHQLSVPAACQAGGAATLAAAACPCRRCPHSSVSVALPRSSRAPVNGQAQA